MGDMLMKQEAMKRSMKLFQSSKSTEYSISYIQTVGEKAEIIDLSVKLKK